MQLYQLSLPLLAPLLLQQGKRVRRDTLRLPEAEGDRTGQQGHGRPLRLLIFGDSAAAGVGATHQHQALSGQLIQCLTPHHPVDWQLIAHSGLTTANALAFLQSQSPRPADVLVLSLGVNDVTSRISVKEWIFQYEKLLNFARQQLDVSHILATAVPPMHQFPALPQPLRWYLGQRAQHFNQTLAAHLHSANDGEFVSIAGQLTGQHMASDGFHPGPAIYQAWANTIAKRILTRLSK
ncbi:SGNH/GDSL hydrolase family protein [Bowmanella sp. JS7-9]|uniref:SGNH/GDSL hydrolase family protein n=1 Tax=Alteromonadaceae TaxID=72275 RepID=UPI00103DF1E8|nr:SGNH/GDSL hydrolase family protein [Bowmanella sp. JS7-9]TBX23714.1 hypothetical protein TK45_06360 [Bowmanella sp. JS7-9]